MPITTGTPCPVCGRPTVRSGQRGRPPTYDRPECLAKAKRLGIDAEPHARRVPRGPHARLTATRRTYLTTGGGHDAFLTALAEFARWGDDHPAGDASSLPDLEEIG